MVQTPGALALGPDSDPQARVELQVPVVLADLVPAGFTVPALDACEKKTEGEKKKQVIPIARFMVSSLRHNHVPEAGF